MRLFDGHFQIMLWTITRKRRLQNYSKCFSFMEPKAVNFLLYHFVDVIDRFLSLFFFVFFFILLKNLWEKWNDQFPENIFTFNDPYLLYRSQLNCIILFQMTFICWKIHCARCSHANWCADSILLFYVIYDKTQRIPLFKIELKALRPLSECLEKKE